MTKGLKNLFKKSNIAKEEALALARTKEQTLARTKEQALAYKQEYNILLKLFNENCKLKENSEINKEINSIINKMLKCFVYQNGFGHIKYDNITLEKNCPFTCYKPKALYFKRGINAGLNITFSNNRDSRICSRIF